MNPAKRAVTYRPSFTVRILAGLIFFLAMLSVCTIVGVQDQTTHLSIRTNEWVGRSIEQGAKVWAEQCARCHGADGKGIEGQGPALSVESFVGRIELKEGAQGQQSVSVMAPSQRLKDIGWTGTLDSYINAVTTSGIPLKSSNAFDTVHPAFADTYGGPLRPDQIANVAAFVQNWGLDPVSDTDPKAILPPKPGEAFVPKPTAVPLTAEQEKGKEVFLAKGCNACHIIKGVATTGATGPNLSEIGTVSEERIASEDYKTKITGQPAATTGPDYIRQSILYPNAYIVPECPQGSCLAGVMPQNFGQQIPPEDLNNLVNYLSSLK